MNEILNELKVALFNPKFLRVLLEWGMPWGLFFGCLFLVLGKWALKDRRMGIIGMIIIASAASLTYPIGQNRKIAKAETMSVESVDEGRKQEARRADSAIFYYILAVICIMNALGRAEGDSGKYIFLAMTIGSFSALIHSLWLQLKESQLIFREF